jgi:hypothetical protein
MSKHIPDTAEVNAGLTTGREASRRDHLPYDIRHMDDVEWETIRWPGETGKMLFHPRPERPIYSGRFNVEERKSVEKERVDL